MEEWKTGVSFIELELHDKDVKQWFDILYAVTGESLFEQTEYLDSIYNLWGCHKYGTVSIQSLVPIGNETKEILSRFAKVFEQTYTRFLDLQKAEAQAREAQIEAALERVRSRSMAMHNSEELHEVIMLVHQQMQQLGLKLTTSNIFIPIDKEEFFDWNLWAALDEATYPTLMQIPYSDFR